MAGIPAPLTEEDEERQREKKRRQREKKREKDRDKKAAEKELREQVCQYSIQYSIFLVLLVKTENFRNIFSSGRGEAAIFGLVGS